MNSKAFVFLYIATIAFIIAIFVFYGAVGKQTPGGETQYFGEKEIQLFQSYQKGEEQVYAIELAALLSAKQASPDTFQRDFESTFAKYLEKYNLKIEDYDLSYTIASGTMTILGRATKNLEFKEADYTYKIKPNFQITIPYTGATENIFQ